MSEYDDLLDQLCQCEADCGEMASDLAASAAKNLDLVREIERLRKFEQFADHVRKQWHAQHESPGYEASATFINTVRIALNVLDVEPPKVD